MEKHVRRQREGRSPLSLILLALFFLGFFSWGWAEEGKPFVASEEVCAVYRQGPVQKTQMAVFSKPDEYRMVDVFFRPEYLTPGFLPFGPVDGGQRPEDLATELFEIDIATGQPVPLKELRTPPGGQHLTLYVTGLSYADLRTKVARMGGWNKAGPGWFVGDRWEADAGPFRYTGKEFFGFQEIFYDDADAYTKERSEAFIQTDSKGWIIAALECDKEAGPDINPGCQLWEEFEFFDAKAHFRKKQMPNIELIQKRVREFVTCLTYEGSSEGEAE